MNAYMNQYQSNSVLTASREQLLIMLYDGAIRFVRQARLAIEENRRADKVAAIGKAVAIITEFSNTLDFEIGGEIALDLCQLYDFMIRELVAVNAKDEVERLDPVEKILLDLRGAFAEAIEINRRSSTQEVSSASGESQVASGY
jgi:flagellar secretion chaperone FliS